MKIKSMISQLLKDHRYVASFSIVPIGIGMMRLNQVQSPVGAFIILNGAIYPVLNEARHYYRMEICSLPLFSLSAANFVINLYEYYYGMPFMSISLAINVLFWPSSVLMWLDFAGLISAIMSFLDGYNILKPCERRGKDGGLLPPAGPFIALFKNILFTFVHPLGLF